MCTILYPDVVRFIRALHGLLYLRPSFLLFLLYRYPFIPFARGHLCFFEYQVLNMVRARSQTDGTGDSDFSHLAH